MQVELKISVAGKCKLKIKKREKNGTDSADKIMRVLLDACKSCCCVNVPEIKQRK